MLQEKVKLEDVSNFIQYAEHITDGRFQSEHVLRRGSVIDFSSDVPDDVKQEVDKLLSTDWQAGSEAYLKSLTLPARKAAVLEKAVTLLVIEKSQDFTPEELGAFDIGFVNLHVSDDLDGKGDGLWYLFGVGKTRHEGDTIMTRSEAIAQGVKLGS